MAPSLTVGPARFAGRKLQKQRLKFLACAKGDGTEKVPFLIIAKANKPRFFNKKSGGEHLFQYYYNKRASLSRNIFFEWLEGVDEYSARNLGRKVVLLLDSCTAHGKIYIMPDLRLVNVVLLPPNTTS